ncbi:aminotransferase class III-fold pyridoxal phosphate-dependent enzyme [Streptococcus sp. H31]|uniref:aminotransferase class III-fold pyridoxal phosphate-dependent enzyme n=1 Tax=Streptococcus huangxiaojuni TaxID=3237239 RepID=UPI0034A494C9
MLKRTVRYPFLTEQKEKILSNLVSAKEIRLKSIDGKTFIDAISGLWNVILGYNNIYINNAIKEQLDSLPFVNLWSNTHDVIEKVAKKLIDFTNHRYTELIYSTTGSETVELAIKVARKYQAVKKENRKKYIVSFNLSYHGTSYVTMSLTDIDKEYLEDIGVSDYGIAVLPFFKKGDDLEFYIKKIGRFFELNYNKIAAVVIEPVLGVGGVLLYEQEIIELLQSVADMYDILIISDEITTGFFRTGNFLGYEIYNNFSPDLICLSKGITNGYLPLGVVMLNEKVGDVLKNEVIPHFSTQNGNLCAMAAANALLSLLNKENIKKNNLEKGRYLYQKMLSLEKCSKFSIEVRYIGMMFSIDIRSIEDSKKLTFDKVWEIFRKIKEKGLITYPFATPQNSGILLLPAYTTDYKDLDEISHILNDEFLG